MTGAHKTKRIRPASCRKCGREMVSIKDEGYWWVWCPSNEHAQTGDICDTEQGAHNSYTHRTGTIVATNDR